MTREAEISVVLRDNTDAGARSVGRSMDRLNQRTREGMKRTGDDSARGFAASFVARVGPLVARAPIGPYVAVAAAGAAPVISASISAAIAGGAALGAVGLGVAIVAQEPQVQAAAQRLGARLSEGMRVDAQPMVAPVLAGIATMERRAEHLRPTFRRIFADAASYAPTLTRALDESLDTTVRGFADIVANGRPVVDMFGVQIPRTVAVVVGSLREITEESGNSASALSAVFTVLQATVALTAGTMKTLNFLLPIFSGAALKVNEMITGSGDAAAETDPKLQALIDSITRTGAAAETTAANQYELQEAIRRYADVVTDAFNAETKFGEALDAATRKAASHGAGLDASTTKGRANRDMLARLAAQTRESADAIAAQAGGQERANAIMATGYRRFLAVADAAGISRRRADELARALGLIPPVTRADVRTNSPAALAEARRIERKLLDIERTYFATVKVTYDQRRNPLLQAAQAQARMSADGGWAPRRAAGVLLQAAGEGDRARTGGPLQAAGAVEVEVFLDGTPFRAMTARAVDDRARRERWRARVGPR